MPEPVRRVWPSSVRRSREQGEADMEQTKRTPAAAPVPRRDGCDAFVGRQYARVSENHQREDRRKRLDSRRSSEKANNYRNRQRVVAWSSSTGVVNCQSRSAVAVGCRREYRVSPANQATRANGGFRSVWRRVVVHSHVSASRPHRGSDRITRSSTDLPLEGGRRFNVIIQEVDHRHRSFSRMFTRLSTSNREHKHSFEHQSYRRRSTREQLFKVNIAFASPISPVRS